MRELLIQLHPDSPGRRASTGYRARSLQLTCIALAGASVVAAGISFAMVLAPVSPAAAAGRGVGRPAAPSDLRAAVSATGAITLTWQAPKVAPHHGAARHYVVTWVAPPIEPLVATVSTHSASTTWLSDLGSGTYSVAG